MSSLIPSTLAEWLKATELVETAQSASIVDLWGDLGIDSASSSPLALRADATIEANRQLAFLGAAIAIETIEVAGRQAQLVGQSRRIEAVAPGYSQSPAVFVVGAEEREGGVTLLTVLRRIEA